MQECVHHAMHRVFVESSADAQGSYDRIARGKREPFLNPLVLISMAAPLPPGPENVTMAEGEFWGAHQLAFRFAIPVVVPFAIRSCTFQVTIFTTE